MARLILYLLESSAMLSLFYLLYMIMLRKETFFSINRFFLLGIVVVSLLFPLVSFEFSPVKVAAVERPLQEISKFRLSYYEAMASWEFDGLNSGTLSGGRDVESNTSGAAVDRTRFILFVVLILYTTGVVVCLSRTVWAFRRIRKMIATYPQQRADGIKIIKVPYPTASFSFLNYVFVHEAMVDTPEFEQILVHERTHIQQKHSIDLIFVQLLAAFLWFNPVIWQLIKSLRTTHEYIADKKIINAGYSMVEYQTLLLKQLISNNSFGLVHNFNLSFIKKRITMMTNKKSGWPGKVKVAVAIAGTVVCSAIIMQCNSRIDEQVIASKIVSADTFSRGINLPVLPESGYIFHGDSADALNVTIAGNKLTINGEPYETADIAGVISKGIPTDAGHIVLRIDKDQKMRYVREVQTELRKADRRKILYIAQTEEGKKVESVILLPPTPEHAARSGMPAQPDIATIESEGKMEILNIDMGGNAGPAVQRKVYDFVNAHLQGKSTDYVVAAKFDDEDSYQNYLLNLAYIKEGFHQLYQERSHSMFGEDYFSLEKERFNAVRQGVPMAISISER